MAAGTKRACGPMPQHRSGDSFDSPQQPRHKAPTVIARTISLDLKGDGWRRFWHFGSAKAAEKHYAKLIVDETTPLIDDLIADVFNPGVDATRAVIATFADDQSKFCGALLDRLGGSFPTDCAAMRSFWSRMAT